MSYCIPIVIIRLMLRYSAAHIIRLQEHRYKMSWDRLSVFLTAERERHGRWKEGFRRVGCCGVKNVKVQSALKTVFRMTGKSNCVKCCWIYKWNCCESKKNINFSGGELINLFENGHITDTIYAYTISCKRKSFLYIIPFLFNKHFHN